MLNWLKRLFTKKSAHPKFCRNCKWLDDCFLNENRYDFCEFHRGIDFVTDVYMGKYD